MATQVKYADPQTIKIQSAGIFAANMQRQSTINRLSGPMPQQADAEGNLRRQSSPKMPIVKAMDLSKTAGEEIGFDLINPISMKPIMGSKYAKGRGKALTFSDDKLRINQARFPISMGDAMTQQRTVHELRALAREQAYSLMDRYSDQSCLVHMAGARGYHNNIEWVVPTEDDADFTAIMVNPVRAPSKNRHWMSTGSGLEQVASSGGELSLASTDLMNLEVVDAIRVVVESMPLPPPPVQFEGDKLASDSPLRVLLVSAEQYAAFVQSGSFRQLQSNAMARASQAGQNPLFAGDAGLWNGILIVRMPKPIRFYAGNNYNYCASATSETETTVTIPASFSTTYAVDRAILLGGQALAEAWGRYRQSGGPIFYKEEMEDFDDKSECVVGAMMGRSKIRFDIDHGALGIQPTDYGVIAIDTVVKLTSGLQ